jgi:ribosomal protein S7
MSELGTGFKTRLEYVLDQICAEIKHGGSHEMRRFVAEQLMAAAEAGERSLDRLKEVARLALASLRDETAPA